ncbi:1-phosphatidylinositol-3-phosphate 5-kinase (Fab1) [Aspergillus rambellii]|uniref:1-phosphatidylinositol-3-phosphate 5-kinase n=1 Tax=Aspergillus rambellii TaxID=308745 RepID=A0A0F8V483_9EURO|nr:1-phosphatidylinositol-3-phosphate 5-kinase (Fab1) [Aspergillus rambellii]
MASQPSQGTSSPSASSIFLPLGRRSSRASISTQAERDSLNAALDQIHTAAYQSEALTVFNDFTSPPAPSSATDEKSISGELQGGLSGLYSRLRTSVGGMRGMVSGVGKSSERTTAEEVAPKRPPLDRSTTKSALEAISVESPQQYPASPLGSNLHSPTAVNPQTGQDGGKTSRVSSKTASISSKASIAPSTAIKPNAPLSKMASSSGTADPTVTELHVNAVKDGSRNPANNSINPSQTLQTTDATLNDNVEAPTTTPMSSVGWNQRLTHSPVLQAKACNNPYEGLGTADVAKSSPGNQSRESAKRTDGRVGHETDTALPPMRRAKRSFDGAQDSSSPLPSERVRSNSSISINPDVSTTASGSRTNSVTQFVSGEENIYPEGRTPSTIATSTSFIDGEAQSKESLRSPKKFEYKERTSISGAGRLPGYPPSQITPIDTTVGAPTITPLNTSIENPIGQDGRNRRQNVGDGVVSQLRSRLLSKDFWMRDENAKDCFHCGEPFSTFRRKHHCRTCGQIFDSKCTLLIPGDRFGQPGTIRVCKPCEQMINGHDDDSSEFSDSEQSPIVVNPRLSELSIGNSARHAADDDDTASIISQSLEHVLKTPTMAIPATRRAGEGHNRRSAILEISPDRPLTRPTSSRSLKSSLSGRPHSIGHKRHHSRQQFIRNFKPYHDDRAPFQRRHGDDAPIESRLPAFHKDNIIDPDLAQYLSDDASSGDEQPSLMGAVSEVALSKSGGDNERTTLGGFLAAMKKGRSAFGDRGMGGLSHSGRELDDGSMNSLRAVNLPRQSRRRNLSVASSIHRQSPRASKDSVFNLHEPQNTGLILPTGVNSSGFKMTRSSSMRGSGAPPVEMNKASLLHVRKLLQQLLNDASVPHAQSWETALLPILLKAADDVDPEVQSGDDMDIRHYIKLKKIPGGRPGDTSYVSGLVFTKNVALKSMPRSIVQPKILIIAFALEYARHQPQFMSLEHVLRQEREFLENLISRIAALRPTLLLVEKNVSGLALELLDRASIATVYNVKSSVLEAVSRCTQTRIITSMDKLVTTPVNSDCGSFDVKTYVYKGQRKTYIYLSGCRKELGCTIVLRGGNHDVLTKVKRITEFMTYVVYNLRLETCLMRDEFAQIPTSLNPRAEQKIDDETQQRPLVAADDNSHAPSPSPESASNETKSEVSLQENTARNEVTDVPDDVPMPTYYEDIVRDHETKILSASPFVRFEPPYLLMRAREMERRLAYLKHLRDKDGDHDQWSEEKAKALKFSLITPEMVHHSPQGAPPKVKEVLHAVHDAEYDRALHHYQTQKRQWEAYISGTVGLFDPYAHQNIVVLFSLVCTTTSIPCSGPDLLALEFYNEHGDDAIFEPDCTLGQYVEDICLNAHAVCTANGCEKRMFEHHRQYVHGEAQISIFTQPCPSKLRGLQDTILMWSCCKVCGNETQVFPMSESTWKYSFGKYLELSFWSKNLHARAGVCPHDLQRDHLRYFGFKDVAIRIHYDAINLLEIIVPRTRVTWKVDNDLRLKIDIYQKIEQRLTKFMLSVKARLKGINVESVLPNLAEDCNKEIENLTRKASEDHAFLVKQLQDRYMDSRYWEVIPLNEVLRSAQEKVVEWDTAFAEFEKNFFPSEKDIRRLATLQLKKIFLDKDASVTSLTSTDEPPTTPTETESEPSQTPEPIRPMRRMTLSPEKAQNVLVSVVEEHSGENERVANKILNVGDIHAAAPSPVSEGNVSSLFPQPPRAEAEAEKEALSSELDIHTNQSDKALAVVPSASDRDDPTHVAGQNDVNTSGIGSSQERLMPQVASRQSDEVDRSANNSPTTPIHPFSSIPRPTDSSFRRSGKSTSPPLFRAQSQPISHRDVGHDTPLSKGLKLGSGRLHKHGGPIGPPHDSKLKHSDKKLSDRFGLSAFRNGRLTPAPSLIPRSIPTKKNRVSSLAKHFEQLSREFEKERQRERDQRAAKGAQSRAFPLASSKPIVEVYKNVREAVEEREPSGEGDDLLSRISIDGSSKGSDDFPKRPSMEEQDKITDTQGVSTPGPETDHTQTDEHILSEAEPEDGHSDEERASSDGLQITDPNEDLSKMSPEDEPMDLKELPKHERSTLLKLLTNFWSERSASGWAPLDYPLTMSDHIFSDCDIIVRDDEPSSLIAFALDSGDYKEKLASIQRRYEEAEEISMDMDKGPEAVNETRVEHALLRSTGTHLKYEFQEGQAKMLCKIFYAEQFDALRKKCGIAERIVESLSRCAKWDSKGGKTKSLFLKTQDDRFILKSLSPIETQAFLKFAPAYFQIMSEALFHELPSAIAKMFGFYQVIIKNPATNTEFNWFLLLMENLFYDRVPTRIFDLKGSMRNRKVQSTGERNEVLLDENMVDFIYETPLFAREHSKKLLSQSVWNDTLFLGRQNVMDYSLMIAIDESRSELVVGVIDCIRTYTWDKKLESWIKDRGFAGGGKNRPTVTSPKEYKGRFREAMARYVLQAPSCWHQFQPSQIHRFAPVDHPPHPSHLVIADGDGAEE